MILIYLIGAVILFFSIVEMSGKAAPSKVKNLARNESVAPYNRDEISEYKGLKQKYIGASKSDLEFIQSVSNPDAYVQDIIKNGRTEYAKEVLKKQNEINLIKINKRDGHIIQAAQEARIVILRRELDKLIETAVTDANHMYRLDLLRAQELAHRYKPMTEGEKQRLVDLQLKRNASDKEKVEYQNAVYNKRPAKNLALFLTKSNR